jgi:hypothetical protein
MQRAVQTAPWENIAIQANHQRAKNVTLDHLQQVKEVPNVIYALHKRLQEEVIPIAHHALLQLITLF